MNSTQVRRLHFRAVEVLDRYAKRGFTVPQLLRGEYNKYSKARAGVADQGKQYMQFSLRSLIQICIVIGLAIGLGLMFFPVSPEEAIKSDVQALRSHAWAGHYSDETSGIDTGPLNVWVSPKGRVFAETLDWWKVREFGTVVENGGVLHVEWENPNRTGRWPTESNLIPVTLRGTNFLLKMSELHPFCLAARGDGEFPYGILRRQRPAAISSQATVNGPPAVGDKFRSLVDLPPIEFRVIQADKVQRRRYSDDEDNISQLVTVDAGSKDNLFVGMEFSPKDTNRSSPILTIRSVQQNQATARWQYYVKPDDELAAVKVGDSFETTR